MRPPRVGDLIDDDALKLVQFLGVDERSVVYRVEETYRTPGCTPKSYAVKWNPHRHPSSRQRQAIMREVTLHQLASAHLNVTSFLRVFEDRVSTYFFMEYAPDHDLLTQILRSRYLGDDGLIRHVFLQLLDAVEYIHSLGIYHRNLDTENVLCFDGGLRVAITDFGLATTDKISDEFGVGSEYHMSPGKLTFLRLIFYNHPSLTVACVECLSKEFAPGGGYSPMFKDIWSLGIILLNLATGRDPWTSASIDNLGFRAYLQDPLDFIPTVLPISDEANNLIARMLETDWRDRLTVPEIRQALEEVPTFYSEIVTFEGGVARYGREAATDIAEEIVDTNSSAYFSTHTVSSESPSDRADVAAIGKSPRRRASFESNFSDSTQSVAVSSLSTSPAASRRSARLTVAPPAHASSLATDPTAFDDLGRLPTHHEQRILRILSDNGKIYLCSRVLLGSHSLGPP
jgi:serine/threonine-protein kinase ULK1